MPWQGATDGLLTHCLRYWRCGRGTRFGSLQVFEGELELGNLLVELLGGAPELHALELRDLQFKRLDLDLPGHKPRLGLRKGCLTLDHQSLECLDIIRQIGGCGHAAL